jgi:hypothetical protein
MTVAQGGGRVFEALSEGVHIPVGMNLCSDNLFKLEITTFAHPKKRR